MKAIAADREKRQDKIAWEGIMKKWYPTLLWERAIDKIAFGPDPEIGLKDAYQIITTYFDHDEMPRWISQFTLLIKPPEDEEDTGAGNETLASLLASLRPPEPPTVLKEDEEIEEVPDPEEEMEDQTPEPEISEPPTQTETVE